MTISRDCSKRASTIGVESLPSPRITSIPKLPGRKSREIVIAQIRRRLHVHLGAENQPGDGDGAQHVAEGRLRMRGHRYVRFGAEILDDDFLNVAVLFMERSNRK